MSRANSLKKAVREIIEHTEKALDDQNEQTVTRQSPPTITLDASEDTGFPVQQKRTSSGLQVATVIYLYMVMEVQIWVT